MLLSRQRKGRHYTQFFPKEAGRPGYEVLEHPVQKLLSKFNLLLNHGFQSLKMQRQSRDKCDVLKLFAKALEEFSVGAVILVSPLLEGEHHISQEYYARMGYKGIVAPGLKLIRQSKDALAGLEEDLDGPALAVNFNYLLP